MNKFSEEKKYSNENCLRSSHYRRKECKLYANKQERRIAFIFPSSQRQSRVLVKRIVIPPP